MKTMRAIFIFVIVQFAISASAQEADKQGFSDRIDSLCVVANKFQLEANIAESERAILLAKEIAINSFGTLSLEFARVSFNHGVFCYNRKELDSSESYYRNAVTAFNASGNELNSTYATCLSNLGVIYLDKGEYEKSRTLCVEAKNIREKVLGKNHPEYVMSLCNIANVLCKLGEDKSAEAYYLEGLSIQDSLTGKDDPEYTLLQNNLGAYYMSLGEFSKAETLYLQSIETVKRTLGNDHLDVKRGLNNLGLLYYYTDRLEMSEKCFLDALKLLSDTTIHAQEEYARVYGHLGMLYDKMGRLDDAEYYYLRSLKLQEHLVGKLHPKYASVLTNLTILYYSRGMYRKAEENYIEIIALRENNLGKSHPEYAGALINLANLYVETGRYEEASVLYFEAKAVFEKSDVYEKHPFYVNCMANLSSLYFLNGDFANADSYFTKTVELWKEIFGTHHSNYASFLANVGSMQQEMGNNQKAESLLNESLKVIEEILGKDHSLYAISLVALGNLYSEIDRLSLAEELYLNAMVIFNEPARGNPTRYAECMSSLGSAYIKTGDYSKALEMLVNSNAMFEKMFGKENRDYAAGLYSIANIYDHLKKFSDAEKLYSESMQILGRVFGTEHHEYLNGLKNIAVFYEGREQYELADSLFKQYFSSTWKKLSESVTFLSAQEISDYLHKYNDDSNIISSVISNRMNTDVNIDNLAEIQFDNELFNKGFLVNVGLKMKSLSTQSARSDSLYNALKLCRRMIMPQMSLPFNERDHINELLSRNDSLEKEFAKSVAGFYDAQKFTRVEEIQDVLLSGDLAIEFLNFTMIYPEMTTEIQYGASVIIGGDPVVHFVPLFMEHVLDSLLFINSSHESEKSEILLAQDQRGIVATNPIKQNATILYEFIWQPLEPYLKSAKNVYYSPSGIMHRMNLATVESGTDEMMSDRFQMMQLTSTRNILKLNRDSGYIQTATIFGGIDFGLIEASEPSVKKEASQMSWPYLEGTLEEAKSLQQLLSKSGITTNSWTGALATEEKFRELEKKSASSIGLIHIATHGYFVQEMNGMRKPDQQDAPLFMTADDPMLRSGLILAGANYAWSGGVTSSEMEDGILTAYEISQINLDNTELVVLSACETGLGDIQGNEGVYGLQRAFKIAGAKYIIMSMWQVPDKQTSMLMTTFYKKWLEEKMTIPDAFYAAQKKLRDIGLDPYGWAGFVLVE